jgi:hypothetical protein
VFEATSIPLPHSCFSPFFLDSMPVIRTTRNHIAGLAGVRKRYSLVGKIANLSNNLFPIFQNAGFDDVLIAAKLEDPFDIVRFV